MHIQKHIRTHTQIYIYIYTHTCTYIDIHTYIAPVGYCTIKLATPKDRRRVYVGFFAGLF